MMNSIRLIEFYKKGSIICSFKTFRKVKLMYVPQQKVMFFPNLV